MADENPRPDTGTPDLPDPDAPQASSDELLAEAWSQLEGQTEKGGGSSEDLIRRARWWLEDQQEAEEPELAGAAIAVAASTRRAMEEEGGFDDLNRVFEAPAPARGPRPRPQPLPTIPPDEASRRPRRVAWLIAAAVIGVAVFANLASVLTDDDAEAPATTVEFPVTTVESPVTTVATDEPWSDTAMSEGSLTSPWTDPCNGAAISGELAAEITYAEDGGEAIIDVFITGNLSGDDGETYDLVIQGSTTGEAGLGSYTVSADQMTLVRGDGTVFSEPTRVTVEVVERRADNWSFTIDAFECPS